MARASNAEIIDFLKRTGATYKQAAKHFGVTRNVVAGVCNRASFKMGAASGSGAAHAARCLKGCAEMTAEEREARSKKVSAGLKASWTPERREAWSWRQILRRAGVRPCA